MNFLSRIVTAVNRYRRAKTLGFTFGRTKFFRPPSSIIFSQNRYPLSFPDENGVAELFRDILLDDEYWLESIPKSRIRTVLDIGANIGMFALWAAWHGCCKRHSCGWHCYRHWRIRGGSQNCCICWKQNEIFDLQKKRIYNALLNSSSEEVINFDNVLKKIING